MNFEGFGKLVYTYAGCASTLFKDAVGLNTGLHHSFKSEEGAGPTEAEWSAPKYVTRRGACK